MPIHRTDNGWKWGDSGKEYPTKEQAEQQAAAAYANGYTGKANNTLDGRKYVPRAERGNIEPNYDVYQGKQGGLFYYPNGGKPDPSEKAKIVRPARGQNQTNPAPMGQRPEGRPEGRPEASRPPETQAKRPTLAPDTKPEPKKPEERQPHRPQPRGQEGNAPQGEDAPLGFKPGVKPHIPDGLPPTADALARMVDWSGTRGEVRNALIDMALSDRFYARRKEDIGRLRFGPRARAVAAKSMDILITIVLRENSMQNKAQIDLKSRRHAVGSHDPFSVKETDTGERMELPPARVYLKEGEQPPAGASVQEGPRGGYFFLLPARNRPLKMQDIDSKPGEDPEHDMGVTHRDGQEGEGDDKSSQTADIEALPEDTMQRIRAAMAQAHIQQSTGPGVEGYQVIEAHSEFDVKANGPTPEEKKRVARLIEGALREGDLQFHQEGPLFHVKPLAGDKKEDVIGDQLKVKPTRPAVRKPSNPHPDDNPLNIKNAYEGAPEGAPHQSFDMVAPPVDDKPEEERKPTEDPEKTEALEKLIESIIHNPLIMEAVERAKKLRTEGTDELNNPDTHQSKNPFPKNPQNSSPKGLTKPESRGNVIR